MMSASNVSAVVVPAGQAVVIAPADDQRTYLRVNNSSLSDLTYSVTQAAAQARRGWRNTGGQADFELVDMAVARLVAAEIWCYNASAADAIVSIIEGYRV